MYEKGDLLFIFNWHMTKSYEGYNIGTKWRSEHFILYDSDEERFDGHKRLTDAHNKWFQVENRNTNQRPYTIKIYLPSRSCIVMCSYEVARSKNFDIPEMPNVNKPEDHLNNHFLSQNEPSLIEMKPSQVVDAVLGQPPKVNPNVKKAGAPADEIDKKFVDVLNLLGEDLDAK